MMKKSYFFVIMLLLSTTVAQAQGDMKSYISKLMEKMTLREKIGQLNLLPGADITTGNAQNNPLAQQIAKGDLGGVFNVKGVDKIKALQKVAVTQSRLHIPLIVGMDVIHGYETVFPIPLALASTWDLDLISRTAQVAAKEATADGICWTFSPMVDICVNPRWGRIAEGAGEDPYLGARVAEAMVKGYQGTYSKYNMMACVKHYGLYGASEAGREYNTVDMSRLRMYNQYFPPYKAAAEAGAGSYMSSFNVVDGIPATANKWLLTDVLRQQWGFNGFVVTDYNSIAEMRAHGVGDDETNAVKALTAGTDMDMTSQVMLNNLEKAVSDGRVSKADINTACRRVLEAKWKLGLFKDPYKYCDAKRRAHDILTPENLSVARQAAAESFVLLKNEGNLLPLSKSATIALIGPLADTRNEITGPWSVAQVPDKYATLKESMELALKGKGHVIYAQGSHIYDDPAMKKFNPGLAGKFANGDSKQLLNEALEAARQADVVVAALGETAGMSGEAGSRANLELPDAEAKLLRALVATGKPVVLLNFSGRPTLLNWESEHVNAIMNVWFGGTETGDAICDVLFGDRQPEGKLTVSVPRSVGQLPLYYNHLNTGRPVEDGDNTLHPYSTSYLDVPNSPLYPFGYGLHYTTFEYSPVELSAKSMTADGSVTASVDVTNTGNRDGYETVQLYIRDRIASISRPVKELKGFSRVFIKKGEKAHVEFTISRKELSFYNSDLKEVVEPGEFDIMIGANSMDVKKAVLNVTE